MSVKSDSAFGLITDVAEKEMKWVGVEPWADMPVTAQHVEAVRRIQAWTFRWMAEVSAGAAMAQMFLELAERVDRVPDIDLWTGRPGTAGGTT